MTDCVGQQSGNNCLQIVQANLAESPKQTLPEAVSKRPAEAGPGCANTLPTGIVTFLFTDIEESTQLLRHLSERYVLVLTKYRYLLRAAVRKWSGYEVGTQGDGFSAVFARATDAVSAAVDAQRSISAYLWPEGAAVRVRMSLHTGEPERSAARYIGLDVHYAARLRGVAHGGQVLLSQTTRALVAYDLPEGVGLRDMGEHRIRDIPSKRRLFQLIIADLAADFPPLRTLDAQFNNLPTQLTALIGREKDVAAVRTLLERTNVRLVTLTGTGGIGKTRLSIEVARQLVETFPDGICFVSLAPVSEPRLVIPVVAHSLGLIHQQSEQRQGMEHMEYLKACWRDKHFLLLLDNFEQVVLAASDVTDLLVSCPGLKLLVTSRAVLHVQGEHEFPVPPLAVPRRTHLPAVEVLAQSPAVKLFIERAQAIKPGITLTKANTQAIAAICAHLDGLPLAIELAAARSKLLPPPALLQRLSHRLDVLTRGAQDAPLRHQTLRNTLDWSYDLLDAAEQQLFRHIAVFAGGCTLSAIAAVSGAAACEAFHMLDRVASLIDKSLLQQSEQEGEEPRFEMLETIREYGLEVLAASGEMEITRQAHAAYYLALAEEAEPEYEGPQQATWLNRLEQERDNLRAALHWSVEQAETEGNVHLIETALRFGGALRRFWLVHGHVNEERGFLERALTANAGGVATSVRAKALTAAANLAVAQNDYHQTEALSRESLELYRELGDQSGMAFSLYLLGVALWNKGNLAGGRALIEEALAVFRELRNTDQVAWSLYLLALFDSSQGEYARASALLEESLALHRVMEHKRGIAFSLVHLAQVRFISQRDQVTVHALLEEGLALSRELGDKDGIANAIALRGQIAFSQGDLATAYPLLHESVLLYREVGVQHGIAGSLCQLARVVTVQGNHTKAYALYEESLAIGKELNNAWLIASCLEGLANVIALQGKPARAAQLWGAAEALREADGAPISPLERSDYERSISGAYSRLGEAAFAAAWSQGREMTPEQALFVREDISASTPISAAAPASPAYAAGLTAREVEVLRLVAQGLTNIEIGEELGLSEKTIAHHMTHIFNKTSSENRAAAVAFAFRHGLA